MHAYNSRERGIGSGAVVTILAIVLVVGVVYWLTQDDDSPLLTTNNATSTVGQSSRNATNTGSFATSSTGTTSHSISAGGVVLAGASTGNFVRIDRAMLTEPGYIVIYRVNSNSQSEVIGHSSLIQAGSHTNLDIQLDQPISKEQTVIAVLHSDDGDGNYEFPNDDLYMSSTSPILSDTDVVDVPHIEERNILADQIMLYLRNTLTATTSSSR